MTGRLRQATPLSSPPGKVGPFSTAASGQYECAAKSSVVANWFYYYAIGNCLKGGTIKVQSYASENSAKEHSYGGFVNGNFNGCGWIDTRYHPVKIDSKTYGLCPKEKPGNEFRIWEETFWKNVNSTSAQDGFYVVNPTPCPEYANYRPWTSGNTPTDFVREVQPYTANYGGSTQPALKWRYTSKYNSADGTGQYVMVRDDRTNELEAKEGTGIANWVFVPRSCLAALPATEGELLPPPAATTGAATNVGAAGATLNGTVASHGVDTEYFFEYGTTTKYTGVTPTAILRAGPNPETIQRPAGGPEPNSIYPNTLYHYRLHATSATGQSLGGDQTFTTPSEAPEEALSSRWAVREVGGQAQQWLYYLGTNHQVYLTVWTGKEWGNNEVPAAGGAVAAANSSPTVVREAGGLGQQWVYYVGQNGQVHLTVWTGKEWGNTQVPSGGGALAAANSSPTVVREAGGLGQQWVYYVGTNGQINLVAWNGKEWGSTQVPAAGGEPAAPNTSPAAVREAGGLGQQWIYYVGANRQLHVVIWNGKEWGSTQVPAAGGEAVAANSSPTVVREAGGLGQQWVYYVGQNGKLYLTVWTGNEWGNSQVPAGGGASAAANTSPTAVREAGGLGQQWVYYIGPSNQTYLTVWTGKEWGNSQVPAGGGAASAANTSPAAIREAEGVATQWIYYIGQDAQIHATIWTGKEWGNSKLLEGGALAELPTI